MEAYLKIQGLLVLIAIAGLLAPFAYVALEEILRKIELKIEIRRMCRNHKRFLKNERKKAKKK